MVRDTFYKYMHYFLSIWTARPLPAQNTEMTNYKGFHIMMNNGS